MGPAEGKGCSEQRQSATQHAYSMGRAIGGLGKRKEDDITNIKLSEPYKTAPLSIPPSI